MKTDPSRQSLPEKERKSLDNFIAEELNVSEIGKSIAPSKTSRRSKNVRNSLDDSFATGNDSSWYN